MVDSSPLYTTTTNSYDWISPTMFGGNSTWAIIAAFIALFGGILLYYLFVRSDKEPKGKFAKWLKDFLSFKTLWIEALLKICYYIATIFTILISFTLIGTDIASFFIVLIVGPVIIRLAYELIMMIIMICRNTADIAKNTKKNTKE